MKRSKVRAGVYSLMSDDGKIFGGIVKTGVPGRDNYPWEWWVELPDPRSSGTANTMREATEVALARLRKAGHE